MNYIALTFMSLVALDFLVHIVDHMITGRTLNAEFLAPYKAIFRWAKERGRSN